MKRSPGMGRKKGWMGNEGEKGGREGKDMQVKGQVKS